MIDMLEVKRDRLKEIKKQVIINSIRKKWENVYQLMKEQRELKEQIKVIVANRANKNANN